MARSRTKILFVTSEVYPLVKTGGLADVSASLPAALRGLDLDVRILLPGYASVLAQLSHSRKVGLISNVAGYYPDCLLRTSHLPGTDVPLLLLDCPQLYDHDGGPYQDSAGKDWPQSHMRFGLLGYVAAMLASDASPLTWRPDLVHCNDWQSGLAPAYLNFLPEPKPPSVMTLHNLAFQGIFPPETLTWLGLPPESFAMNGVEYYGQVSFLKAGLFYADRITTVSPTYAEEIQQEPLGMGMQGLLATRQADLTGILNGIDEQAWDPRTDPNIEFHYGADSIGDKRKNKAALQRQMGLDADAKAPLLGIVSRLTGQKGIDIVIDIVPQLMALGCQLAVLGSGDAVLSQALTDYAELYPGKVAVHLGYDEVLSHRITAGIDLFLMPSRFEPCGLNQMYSQRYGTPPIVSATGGLVDSVTDASETALAQQQASGIVFHDMTTTGLLTAIERAVAYYRDAATWPTLQRAGMVRDFSWKASALSYLALYRSLIDAK
jgi:starch synthase